MVVVRAKRSQLASFRARARRTPKEIHAYLVGKVVSPKLVVITRFVYPVLEESTPAGVRPDYGSWKKIKEEAEAQGLLIVGDIHSHPNWWPVLSPTDHEKHIVEGNRLSGVCAVMNNRTKVYFWVAESSLPCKINYL